MKKLSHLSPERVFYYFERITAIPRGSGNMASISNFCVDFAKEHNLDFIHDDADNVIIYKDGTDGYENSDSVILQGHLDMVCQKTVDCNIDFEKDGLDIFTDGDFIKAKGTTLGADNGIAVAMIFAILESDSIPHPPIEAVLTTDEETGMIGAGKLPFDKLKSKKMINIDSEDLKTLTVACAGGSDFQMHLPLCRKKESGTRVVITLKGLKGGHSGVEIDAGRVNADILAGRILSFAKKVSPFSVISINGGDKGNAIPRLCKIELCVKDAKNFASEISRYLDTVKKEISSREENFAPETKIMEEGTFSVIDSQCLEKLIFTLLNVPNGIMQMSASIEGLVETSLNLGVLQTNKDCVIFHFALRSNILSAMEFLEERLLRFADFIGAGAKTSGHYPPWELIEDSPLQRLYKAAYHSVKNEDCTLQAIHAGLECAVFATNIKGLDCISVGPDMYDIHTTDERLSISSTAQLYQIILELLKNLK